MRAVRPDADDGARMNKPWHDKHVMPKSATTAQRIVWHVEHQKQCGCRPIPKQLRERMEDAMAPRPSRNAPQFVQIGEIPPGFDRLGALLPKDAKKALVYLLPISMRYGPEKLRALIGETLNTDVEDQTAYVFTNAKRDSLLVYWLDHDGEQTMQQRLDKGGFALPELFADGLPWASIESKKLRGLFRG